MAHRDMCTASAGCRAPKPPRAAWLMDASITSSVPLEQKSCFGLAFRRQRCLLQARHECISGPRIQETD